MRRKSATPALMRAMDVVLNALPLLSPPSTRPPTLLPAYGAGASRAERLPGVHVHAESVEPVADASAAKTPVKAERQVGVPSGRDAFAVPQFNAYERIATS